MPCLSPSVMVDSASVAEIEREKRRNSIQKVDQILQSSFLKRFPFESCKASYSRPTYKYRNNLCCNISIKILFQATYPTKSLCHLLFFTPIRKFSARTIWLLIVVPYLQNFENIATNFQISSFLQLRIFLEMLTPNYNQSLSLKNLWIRNQNFAVKLLISPKHK